MMILFAVMLVSFPSSNIEIKVMRKFTNINSQNKVLLHCFDIDQRSQYFHQFSAHLRILTYFCFFSYTSILSGRSGIMVRAHASSAESLRIGSDSMP